MTIGFDRAVDVEANPIAVPESTGFEAAPARKSASIVAVEVEAVGSEGVFVDGNFNIFVNIKGLIEML